jgi:hypothetical protein
LPENACYREKVSVPKLDFPIFPVLRCLYVHKPSPIPPLMSLLQTRVVRWSLSLPWLVALLKLVVPPLDRFLLRAT